MKNTFSSLLPLVAAIASALTLGSCSRAEYAMLPKGSSYHGVARVATPVPAAPEATPAPVAAPAVATVPAAATRPAPPAAKAPAPAPQPQAVAAATAPAAAAPKAESAAPVAAPAKAPKASLVQRLALNNVVRKMDKLVQQASSVRPHDNTASTSRRGGIDGNLRLGIILLLVGLIVSLINYFIGAVIAVLGLIFIVLFLLDQA